MALHDEHVAAAHALGEPGTDLAVGELDDVRVAEQQLEMLGHLVGKCRMGPPGVERQALGGDLLHQARGSRRFYSVAAV